MPRFRFHGVPILGMRMSAHTHLYQITNNDGRRFHVRLSSHSYQGHAAEDGLPVIEFFDASTSDGASDTSDVENDLGYFTGIRCSIATLFETAFELGSAADTLFNENFPIWNIEETEIGMIQNWVSGLLSEQQQLVLAQALLTNKSKKTQISQGQQENWEPDTQSDLACLSKLVSEPTSEAVPPFSPEAELLVPTIEEVAEPASTASPARSHTAMQLEMQLHAILAALDQAESLDKSWHDGEVKLRLHLLKAKQQVLKAIAFLES